MINRLFAWCEGNLPIALLALALALFALLSPGDPEPGIDLPHLDKLVHVVLFAGFTLSWLLAIGIPSMLRRVLVLLLAILLALMTELAQQYIPHRSSDWYDLLANSAGISLGLLVFVLRLKTTRSKAGKQ